MSIKMKPCLKQCCIIAANSLLLIIPISCTGTKYVEQLPYLYSQESISKELAAMRTQIDSTYTGINCHDDKLSDEDLDMREKYSVIMGVMPKKVTNYKLYSFIDRNIDSSPKKQINKQDNATNCSAFTALLFNEVYQESISQFPEKVFSSKSFELFTGRSFLQEGDILFFRYDKLHPISDMGVYLQNDRILACTKNGLNIYDFNDQYFQLRYVTAGRLKVKN